VQIWQGSGKVSAPASVKLFVRLDLRNGTLQGPVLTAGRHTDTRSPLSLDDIPAGGLYLADLGTALGQRFGQIVGKAAGLRGACAGYLGHPFKKQAHGDDRAGFTLLAGCLIPEGTSGRTACARWLCTSLSSAKQELHERSHLGNQPIVQTDVQSRQYTVMCCRSFALSGGNKSPTPI
jgi:hypothetical protein